MREIGQGCDLELNTASPQRHAGDENSRLFSLDALGYRLPKPISAPIERFLCFPRLNAAYEELTSDGPPRDFCRAALDSLNLKVGVDDQDLERIPAQGPVIVLANHPFGGVEALILTAVLMSVRRDVKMLANHLLASIPDLLPLCIFVDPFGARRDLGKNVTALKQAIYWLRSGGALGVFPAGEVAHLDVAKRRVTDPSWSAHVAALARRTGARVLPVHFGGGNGATFQIAGLLHDRLRTVLLPRQLLNKRDTTCKVRIGSVISPRVLSSFESDEECISYLRLRSDVLSGSGRNRRAGRPWKPLARLHRRPTPGQAEPLAGPVATPELEREIGHLPPDSLLAKNNELEVYLASAQQMPLLLTELGRLRELTFREVGEGTGRRRDLDRFDRSYLHLIVWDSSTSLLVGAYRLGPVDRIVPIDGREGLYVDALFRLSNNFIRRLGPGIELGRSFVRPEYQKSFAPLMLLWRGLGQFVARFPHYRSLFGPVSISGAYRMKSRALIVAYFSRTEFRSDLAVDVRPRNPFPIRQADREDVRVLARMTRSVDELSRVVSDIEPDGKGLPVLLRQYLKLGARFLAFGIDPRFGHCVDGLIELDVPGADPRTLQRYMGREAARSYLAVHAGHRQAADARADSGLDVSDEAELYHDPQPTPEHAVA